MQVEVASYGKQLGKVLEALRALSTATDTPLPVIDTLVTDIEAVKLDSRIIMKEHAREALARLRAVDEDGWREVVGAP